MTKPTVYYTPNPLEQIRVGESALIFGLTGHPSQVSGAMIGKVVLTSPVVEITQGIHGMLFETLNTVYVPMHKESVK